MVRYNVYNYEILYVWFVIMYIIIKDCIYCYRSDDVLVYDDPPIARCVSLGTNNIAHTFTTTF